MGLILSEVHNGNKDIAVFNSLILEMLKTNSCKKQNQNAINENKS